MPKRRCSAITSKQPRRSPTSCGCATSAASLSSTSSIRSPRTDEVIKTFRQALARDKTRTQVFDISELGLVEMTRKRIGRASESVTTACDSVMAVASHDRRHSGQMPSGEFGPLLGPDYPTRQPEAPMYAVVRPAASSTAWKRARPSRSTVPASLAPS